MGRGGIVVATGNAASGRDHRGRPALGSWAWAVARLDLDVLAVQEVDRRLPRSGGADQTAEIAAALDARDPDARPWTARFAAAVLGTPGHRDTFRPVDPAAPAGPEEPGYGVALLSRHPVRQWWEHRFEPSRAHLPLPVLADGRMRLTWVPDEPRVALAGRVVTAYGEVTVVCTHLSFAPLRAAAQLRELVSWAADLPRPLVLLGDLNLPGRTPARITSWVPSVQARTYPATRPVAQLDHVLLDDPDGRLHAATGEAVTVADGDHLALRVELRR